MIYSPNIKKKKKSYQSMLAIVALNLITYPVILILGVMTIYGYNRK